MDELLVRRIGELNELIAQHAPDPQKVTVVAVTKTFGHDVVQNALDAGLCDLGENYAQELAEKGEAFQSQPVRWHAIGPVQRNKVKRIAPFVHLWHTLDRAKLATEIGKRSPGAKVLLQVNFTGEETKSGCDPDATDQLLEQSQTAGLNVLGLMTMGPTDASVDPRPTFVACRALADHLGLDHCSMGMSRDVAAALEEGATYIRVGTALFGPRKL